MTSHQGLRAKLQGWIPPTWREAGYRVISGVLTFLTGYGILDGNNAVLWSQLGIGTVTSLFALLYATSSARAALYAIVGPLGGVLMAYGIIQDEKMAVISAALAQVFGIATAAAKTVELAPVTPALSGASITRATTGPSPTHVAVSVTSPRQASAVRKARRAGPRTRRRARASTG
jgi:hypothetical protein